MKTLSARLVAVTVGLMLLAGPAWAQDRIPLEKSRTATGTIAFIQKETRQFVLKGDDNAHYIFALDERTSIRENDKDVRLLDMGVGMKATVTYTPGNDKYYAVSVVSTGKKTDDTAITPEKPREASPIDAEPITVKGKIEKVSSDLAEITVRSFDDKVLTFQVDEDTRQRFKQKNDKVPDLSKGTEVTAVYMIQNGRNRLVTLSDLVQPEPNTGGTSTANSTTMPRNTGNNRNVTNVMPPNATNTNVQAGVAQPPFGGLPLIAGGVLPGGFVATSNNVAGSLNGSLAMARGGLLIVSTAGGTVTPVPMPRTNGTAVNSSTTGTNNNITPVANNVNPGRPDLFAVMAVNSREPFILDGSTRILSNNQPIRWQQLREGMMIQAHFNMSGDGTKVVHTIIVMDNRTTDPATTTNITPTNPNNQPAARDNRGNPIQPNQVPPGGQEGTGKPPASSFPPLPPSNQQPPLSPGNQQPPLPGDVGRGSTTPPGTQNPTTNATNIVSGRIARMKFDSLYLQRSGNDFSFFATQNSAEPLRMDNGTRFTIDGKEGNLAGLQPGMQVKVFVEFVNNVRRVIGIVATSQNSIQPEPARNP